MVVPVCSRLCVQTRVLKGHTVLKDLLLVFHALDKELKSISVTPDESRGNTKKFKKCLQLQCIHH